MQGGVRRKKDMLPRYKNGSRYDKRRSWLTTPMKKVVIYCLLLLGVFLVLRVGYSDLNRMPDYELEHDENSMQEIADEIRKNKQRQGQPANLNGGGAVVASAQQQQQENDIKRKIIKENFNNEVAKQQETKNLEKNDIKPHVDEKKLVKQPIGAKITSRLI
ncbi:uncharacterized protein KNAG_0H00530 [Huiozyma naganishii CBS 8797]|uniref:Uncharacterized protein n=1 Tax=Huiozyma naganishii (strain ATCC MYA-139 / BCRC 22969 / CBS 8797 / KCTC 17520 / NBRC 10181 / NCYC 3082 / Yp74L-3) TaxID=1071383 RepID=J7S8D7_HUIN7|nr:hypothetical protein KNAG_0H00530 [Kazachstania naganishii CBS 8797]CCK71469.1 hypothetical protein KNAG_0H00530 [Kazachstania naganishii CBS 8797]